MLKFNILKTHHYIFLFLFLISGIFWRILLPCAIEPYQSPDEKAHFKYVEYIYENNHLPKFEQKDWSFHEYEYYQPPAYYWLLSRLGKVYRFITNSNFNLITARQVNNVFSLVILILLFLFYIKKYIDAELVLYFLFFWSCWPVLLVISSSVNNDNLLNFFSILVFLIYFIKRKPLLKTILWGLTIGFGLYAKTSVVIPAMFCFLVYLSQGDWSALKEKKFKNFIQSFKNLFLFGTIILTVSLPNFAYNYHNYGQFSLTSLGNIETDQALHFNYIKSQIKNLMRTSIYIAGRKNEVSGDYKYFSYMGFCFILLLSLLPLKNLIKKTKDNSFTLICSITILLNLALVLFFGLNYAQSQGRFLLPSLPFIAFLTYINLQKKPVFQTALFIAGFLLSQFYFVYVLERL